MKGKMTVEKKQNILVDYINHVTYQQSSSRYFIQMHIFIKILLPI